MEEMNEMTNRNFEQTIDTKKHEKENIPVWIERGKNLIYPERYNAWEECVKDCTNVLNHGKEIELALEVMTTIENNTNLETAKDFFQNNINSILSKAIVRDLVFQYSSKGPEFFEATMEKITEEARTRINEKKQENMKLAKTNSKDLNNQSL